MSRFTDHARQLIQRTKSDVNQFGTLILFDNNEGATANVYGFEIKHSLGFNPNSAKMQNEPTRRISLSERTLIAAGYPTRDPHKKTIAIDKHKVTYTDSSGVTGTYVISMCIPGETVGDLLITLTESNIPKS